MIRISKRERCEKARSYSQWVAASSSTRIGQRTDRLPGLSSAEVVDFIGPFRLMLEQKSRVILPIGG